MVAGGNALRAGGGLVVGGRRVHKRGMVWKWVVSSHLYVTARSKDMILASFLKSQNALIHHRMI